MFSSLTSAFDLLLVIVGFGMVVFIHELGHFLAAKWAGVRVQQFAVGFGSAALAYRKGLGLRAGSTEREYEKLLAREAEGLSSVDIARVSPTEYRLNWIPFGGYVKMLGQEDLDPAATSSSPDSYTQKSVSKRMVIISAGVVMNILLAATLFVIVYLVGRNVPTTRLGSIAPGSPAANATLVHGDAGATPKKIEPGDVISRINGAVPKSFNDVALEVVMAKAHQPIELEIERAGVDGVLTFAATPRKSAATGMLELGLGPAISNRVLSPPKQNNKEESAIEAALDRAGLEGVKPGMTLLSVNGAEVDTLWPLTHAMESSGGAPAHVVFQSDSGQRVERDVAPLPELQLASVAIPGAEDSAVQQHLLGLAPAVKIATLEDRAKKAGLEEGDVLVQVGGVAWPDVASAIGEIRRHKRSSINLTVLRQGRYVDVAAPVDQKGRIGFGIGLTTRDLAVVTRVPMTPAAEPARNASEPVDAGADANADVDATANASSPLAATRLALAPGSIVLAVNDAPVKNFFQLRQALRSATASALSANSGAEVTILVRSPVGETFNTGPTSKVAWSLSSDDVKQLHALGWRSPVDPMLFGLDETRLRTSNPVRAVVWGVQDTRSMMAKTYLTFVRLFQGTVQVNQLKGPVGIAHLGTLVAERGMMDLLFFLGLISVNLAVINFLPIPIADGGHFVMLLIEKISGKPVSPAIQNIASLAGLALIGVVFIVVTYNDISQLFGG